MREPFSPDPISGEEELGVTMRDAEANTILCALAGEVDTATGPRLRDELIAALGVGSSHLVVDLSDVGYLGSAGLKILVDVRARQQAVHRHVAIVTGRNHAVIRPLHVTGLDGVFDLHVELATALRACEQHRASATRPATMGGNHAPS